MRCRIAIPTFNRATLIGRAVRSALDQSYPDVEVMVVDDGSTDGTRAALDRFATEPRFTYVRLRDNVGTAAAKNVAIALGTYDAITFHDSDDIAERDKLLRQASILAKTDVAADPILNWAMAGRVPGPLDVSVALTQHWLFGADGSRRLIARALSLTDDFFPQLQMNAGPLGDWILINPGLFRRSVFARAGGFENCVEEDRELRNRLLMHGDVMWLIDEPLLSKIECNDSLTVAGPTAYASPRRRRDRALVWERAAAWRAGGRPPVVPIDLAGVVIDGPPRPLGDDLPFAGRPAFGGA